MRSSNVWGLVFIAIGIIILLVAYSIIPAEIFSGLSSSWPLFIVAIFLIIGIAIMVFSRNESKIEEVKK